MVKLTSMVKTSGCAAKLPAEDLHKVIDCLEVGHSENLIEGFESADDALVYDLGDGRVMIQTLDFFPPMVDNPHTFGEIAAANALSDVYAMGGKPEVAMNLMCFPACLELDVMREILEGGLDKTREAGCVVAGGHTISDPTPKYGLSVTGFARKDSFWSNRGAQVGDYVVLTKKIGVGVINTAAKGGVASEESIADAIESMTTLNRRAMETGIKFRVHAATDVTGFSLLGHASEVADGSGVTIEIDSSSVPLIEGALENARLGLIPEGAYYNRDFLEGRVEIDDGISRELQDLMYDPQTSGGLLLFMSRQEAEEYVREFGNPASIIGRVIDRKDGIGIVLR